MDDFPHEFSGGQRQRIVIAIAMANDPDVMIADEPTTALDVTIQAQVLDALRAARDRTGASLMIITHDLGVVAGMADRVMVMYAGKAVEAATADVLFHESKMPYTLGLLGSLPRMDSVVARAAAADPGQPAVADQPAGRVPVRAALPRGHPALPRGGTGAEPRRAGARGRLHPGDLAA